MDTNRIKENIKKARSAGYSDDQIKNWLSTKGYPTTLVTPETIANSDGVVGFGVGVAKSIGETAASMMDLKNSPTLSLAGTVNANIAERAQQATDFNKQATGLTETNLTASNPAQLAGKITGTAAQIAMPIAGGVAKKAGEMVANGVKKTTTPITNSLKATGENITALGLRPTTQEAERIISYRANNPFLSRVSDTIAGTTTKPTTKANTATRLGIFGRQQDIGIQSQRAARNLWTKEIQPALDNSTDIITKDELFSLAQKKIDDTLEPGKKQALQDAFDALQEDYVNVTQYPLAQAQKVKSELDSFTPTKLFKGKDVASEYAVLKHELADAIRYKIYSSLKDEGIKQKYLDYANLSDLASMGVNALTQAKQLGGAGSFTMAMIDKALVPISSTAGRFVYKLGDAIEITSPVKVKTLAEHLANNGVPQQDFAKFISALVSAQTLSRLYGSDDAAKAPKKEKTK